MFKLHPPIQTVASRPLQKKIITMNPLPKITEAQWDQLLSLVGRITQAAAYISRKLALLQWLGVLSALLLGAVIHQWAELKPLTAALAGLALLLPALALWRTRKQLQELGKAPQAIAQIRTAVTSLPAALHEAVLNQKDGALKWKDQGGVMGALKQVRLARQAVGDIKSRFQGLPGTDFLVSLLAIATPLFFFQLLLAALAIIGLTLITVLAAAAWLIAQ